MMSDATLAGAITAPAITYTLPSGRAVVLRPVTFRSRAIAQRIDKATDVAEQDALLRQLVALLAPDVTDDEFLDLMPAEVMELGARASLVADRAIAAVGNAEAPADDAGQPARLRRPRSR